MKMGTDWPLMAIMDSLSVARTIVEKSILGTHPHRNVNAARSFGTGVITSSKRI
jgi:hypothetical protein